MLFCFNKQAKPVFTGKIRILCGIFRKYAYLYHSLVAAVISAAMLAASMSFAVLMVVMIAADIRVKGKSIGQKRMNGFICVSLNTAIQFNSSFSESRLRSSADTAADKDVCLICS